MPLPFLVALLINTAISIGLSLIVTKLTTKKRKPLQESGGAIIEVQYGEDTPRQVAIGKCAVRGLAVFDNSFGQANSTLQRVIKLSDFRTTQMTRVAINGDWVTLGEETSSPAKGKPVSAGDYAGLIWVKYYDGTQTTADDWLIDNANPAGRWTEDHIGTEVSYVIVTMIYDAEKLNSIPEIVIEFEGAPLYDIRLDTTAGGSGSHRWNDVDTWEYSANPILADYCYRRGFYTGTYGSGHDVFLGMGMDAGLLDYDRYAAAADICDETVDDESRYVISIVLEADREHGDNIEDMMQACAGMVVEAVDGHYPILGATQTPVATLTDDDLIADEPREFRRYRPMNEIVNTVFGTYIEPEFVYSNTGYEKQTTSGAVSLDRRTLDFQLNFPMVPSKRQAEQLASIYFNENRYEATAKKTVREKWQVLEVGDWINWTGDEDGEDRIYQIVAMTIRSIGADKPRVVDLELQERHEDIYAGIGTVTPPTAPTLPGAPSYLQELQNFAVAATYVGTGTVFPAIRVTWDAVTDPTVSGILIEWRPTGDDTRLVSKVVSRGATVAVLEEGVVGSTEYQVRNTLIPDPYRTTTPSAWSTVTTNALGSFVTGDQIDDASVDLAKLAADVDSALARFASKIDSIDTRIEEAFHKVTFDVAQGYRYRKLARDGVTGVRAKITSVQTTLEAADAAIASDVTTLETSISDAETAIAANSDAIDAIDVRVTTAEGTITSQGSAITSLQSGLTTAEGDIDTNASAISSLDTRVTSAEGSITSQGSAITALESEIDLRNRTFVQTSAPTADNTGDLWFDSDDDYKPYRWDGASWVAVQDTRAAKTFAATSAPTATAVGDLWIDTDDDNKLYRWNGTSWAAVPDGRISTNASAISSLDTRVTSAEGTITSQGSALTAVQSEITTARGGESALGDRLDGIDTDVSGNASAISSLDTRVTTAEGTITSQGSALTAVQSEISTARGGESALGDRLDGIDTDLAAKASSAALSALDTRVTTAEGTITSQGSAITALQSDIDLRNRTFVQTTAPTADNVGDLWFDSDDSNKPYRWNGSSWVSIAGAAGNVTFAQTSAPTATSTGDLWIDTDDDNKLYRWNGSSWVAIPDGRIDTNASAISSLDTRVTTAEGTISSQGSALTAVQSEISTARGGETVLNDRLDGIDTSLASKATASALSALDSRVTTAEGTITSQGSALTSVQGEISTARGGETALGDRLDGIDTSLASTASASSVTALDARVTANEGDITANASAITAVEARGEAGTASGLFKIEAVTAPGGVTTRLGGFLRTTDGGSYEEDAAFYLDIISSESRFVIAADRTVMQDSSGNIYSMFDATGAKINGALIVDGSITAASIEAGTITADEIEAGGITDVDQTSSGTYSGGVYTGEALTFSGGSGGVIFSINASLVVGTSTQQQQTGTAYLNIQSNYEGGGWTTIFSRAYPFNYFGQTASIAADMPFSSTPPGTGSVQYRVQCTGISGGSSVLGVAYIKR